MVKAFSTAIRTLAIACLAALMAACSHSNDDLLAMIPGDARGVMVIDVPTVLHQAGIEKGGKLTLPQSLQAILDDNDGSPLCAFIDDLPRLGLDTDCKAYVFFPEKNFAAVLLMAIDDEGKCRSTLERNLAARFESADGCDILTRDHNMYALGDATLAIALGGATFDAAKAKTAVEALFAHNAPSIRDNAEVMRCIDENSHVNAYVKREALQAVMARSAGYRDIVTQLPIIQIFTESDADALIAHMTFGEKEVTFTTNIKAADTSDYARLLDIVLATPNAAFLSAIPETMDYVVAMSVDGKQFVELEQVKAMIAEFDKLPYLGRFDLRAVLATVDGPMAVGVAADKYLQGQYNAVATAHTTDPDAVLAQIDGFARAYGQAPELRNGEYIYEYDNKVIQIGIVDDMLYVKMLNYQQTEGYLSSHPQLTQFFADKVAGFTAVMPAGSTPCRLTYGMSTPFDGQGRFAAEAAQGNAALLFVEALCSIRPAGDFDNPLDADF